MSDVGTFFTEIGVESHYRLGEIVTLPSVLVDTGAEATWVPRAVLEQLGVVAQRRERYQMADGRVLERDVGYVIVHVADKATSDDVVFAEPGDLTILGARSLEGLNLRVDSRRKELVSAGPIVAAVGAALMCCALAMGIASPAAAQHQHPSAERLGVVRFPTSCNSAVAPTFERGIALLHSFEFGASIRAFNEVLAKDSTCAMAYWGLAISSWTNPMVSSQRPTAVLERGKRASDAALRLSSRATPREQGYISAVAQLFDDYERRDQRTRVLAYERAMRDLVLRQPADTEAKIFHAISLVAAALPTDKTFANQLAAGKTLEELWVKQPDHPGLAHYIIHAYDYPAIADKARQAAARYATIAPSAAHALHMPSHTFTRVGMWESSVASNLRSRETALRDGSVGEALHASDYMMYAYLQLGRTQDAKAVLDSLPALAARFDPTAITGAAPPAAGFYAIAAIPARWVMEREAWAEAAALEPKATDYPYADAITYFARAIGASRTGDLVKARASVDSLGALSQRLAAREPYWSEQVAIQRLGAEAWLALAEKRTEDALAKMREAVVREDATDKSATSPGPLAPARELLADMLATLGRTAEATQEYRRTLEKEPGRRRALRGAGRS